MKREIKYIELKSGFSDNGPAWIGLVQYSKSGQTIYFNNMALKKLKVPGVSANYFDIETGAEYWISGVKKNGDDRHWAGGGKVMIDKNIIHDYLELVNFSVIQEKHFDIVSIDKQANTSRFDSLENEKKKPYTFQTAKYDM